MKFEISDISRLQQCVLRIFRWNERRQCIMLNTCDDEFYNFEKWYTQRGPVSRRIHLLSGWNFRYQPDDERNSRSYENRSRFQWKLYASVDNIWNSQVRTELDTGIFLITPVFQTKLLYLVAIRFSWNHARPSNRSFV